MEYKIRVVGIGPGSPDYLMPVGKKVIDQATILVGSKRALEILAPPGVKTALLINM